MKDHRTDPEKVGESPCGSGAPAAIRGERRGQGEGSEGEIAQGAALPRRWRLSAIAAGALALLWLLFRTGSKPTRIAYPCQQAALSAASLAFGAALVAGLLAARRLLLRVLLHRPAVTLAGAVVIAAAVGSALFLSTPQPSPALAAPADYRATIYYQKGCPDAPGEDRFPGLDDLLATMGSHGLKFYRSGTAGPTAGPEGIVGKDDVVIVKINYQWPQRGGTNTDLLKGLIYRIVNHPDGFAGEVVVCENTQSEPAYGLDRPDNNAADRAQSPHVVVERFAAMGHRVGQYVWTGIRTTKVQEYSAGDTTDGYVVLPLIAGMGHPSYPKFTTAYGTRISLKYGVWNASTQSYDKAHLKVLNVPVLKSHHATYGATACVKHYMGVVTDSLQTESHTGIGGGLLGQVMVEVGLPDLNILDCVYVNANPMSGPATTYAGATRRDELLAGRDPVALDIWAVKNILIPAFTANGYKPPWPAPSADPDSPASHFRVYLDRSMNRMLAAGYEVTNDLSKIDLVSAGQPSNLSAEALSGTRVRLAWIACPGTWSGYSVERKTGGTDFVPVASLGADATSWEDQAVEAGKTYSYRVKATAPGGDSPYSNEVSVTTPSGPAVTVTGVTKAGNPFRLNVAGSGFQSGCRVEIDGAAVPTTQFVSAALVKAKGSGLKAMVPKGVTVQVKVINPDGTASAPFPYTR